MTVTSTRIYRLGEFHSFEAAKRRFLYLVPAGAVFELDDAATNLIDRLSRGETALLDAALAGRTFGELCERLSTAAAAATLLRGWFDAGLIIGFG